MQNYLPKRKTLKHVATAPFIYSAIAPVALLHGCVEIYHHVCFPLYGIQKVERSKYVRIDRHKLEQLTTFQKVNCMYCGYVNGVLAYMIEIAGQTEKYWCPIKHENDEHFVEPEHHANFGEYGSSAEKQKEREKTQ